LRTRSRGQEIGGSRKPGSAGGSRKPSAAQAGKQNSLTQKVSGFFKKLFS
jgi:hypothetical protein